VTTAAKAVGEVATAVRRGPSSEWVARSARLGLVARGVVYAVVGLIALQIAWGRERGDEEASKDGALEAIAEQPFGRGLLVALAAGILGFLVWRGSEALWGRDDEDDDDDGPKVVAKRLASAGKALVYVVVLGSTVRVIARGASSSSGSSEQQPEALTARALELPAGQLLVGGVGVVLLGSAVWFAFRGISQRFEDKLDTSEMGPVMGRFVDVVGTLGMTARGLVAGVLGFLVLKAALDYDPDEATGIDGTLRTIAAQPYGRGLLSVTAVGLVAFALTSFAEARYRDL
jgi:hypothetical protein